ncbi:MAG: STAS domain-containing protein [Capsulimonadaceae bacterium]
MAEFEIDCQVVSEVPTVYLSGELDSYSSPRIRLVLEKVIDGARPSVVVHLGALEYIDSAGLAVLVAAQNAAKDRGGRLLLVGPSPGVARVFRVTGLDSIFVIFETEECAHEHLRLMQATAPPRAQTPATAPPP